jgi:hypothetical protein
VVPVPDEHDAGTGLAEHRFVTAERDHLRLAERTTEVAKEDDDRRLIRPAGGEMDVPTFGVHQDGVRCDVAHLRRAHGPPRR